MDQIVRDFFLEYERANSASDISGIGSLYGDTFMFAGPNGVQAVKKEEFLKMVPKRKAYFVSRGLSESRLESIETNPLDVRYLSAKVAWKMTVQTSSGDRTLDTSATYILKREDGDALSIIFQIDHQDLASIVSGARNSE